jgi:hypothetical protein
MASLPGHRDRSGLGRHSRRPRSGHHHLAGWLGGRSAAASAGWRGVLPPPRPAKGEKPYKPGKKPCKEREGEHGGKARAGKHGGKREGAGGSLGGKRLPQPAGDERVAPISITLRGQLKGPSQGGRHPPPFSVPDETERSEGVGMNH